MLGKLMKYEWIYSWKIPTALLGALLVISFGAGLTFAAPIWETEMEGLTVLVILVWMMYYFALIGVSLGVTLYLAVRFYKSMFTDEGYLTHTLPVTSRQLLISKSLPMAAWLAISSIVVCISIAIFGGMAVWFMKPENVGFWEYIFEGIEWSELHVLFENGAVNFLLSIIVMSIISVFSGVMMIVGSVSIGQLVSKHKILGSIGAYFLINTVFQIITTIIITPVMFLADYENDANVFQVLAPTYWIIALLSLIVAVGLYILSEFLVKKKLNLD